MKTFLAEIKGYDPGTSSEKTLYFSTLSVPVFAHTDANRPDILYQARISDIGSIPRYMYGSGRTTGSTSSAGGSIDLINADNALDDLLPYGFDGRGIAIYRGDVGSPFNSYTKVISGTVELPEFTFTKSQASTVHFVLRDKWKLFDKNISQTLYAGTNTGPTGNEGLADDLKGKRKPLCFGQVFNITPTPCNVPGLRYQVHNGAIQDVTACYIDGIAQTKVAAPPGAAQYSVDTATGIITLGSSPAGGQVTCDVQGYKPSGTYYTKVGDLISSICQVYGGLTAGEINSAAIAALNAANSATVGVYYDGGSEVTIAKVLDELINSIGGYTYFDRLGVLQVGRISDPASGTSLKTFIERDFDEFEIIASNDEEKGVPAYRVTVNHTVNYTVQTKVAGAVTDARLAWLGKDKRAEQASDAAVKTVYLLSPEMTRDTYLTSASDAANEATRLLNLYKVRRGFYKAVIELDANAALDLGQVVTVKMNRFSLSAGKKLLIIGIIEHAPTQNKMTLELWG